ncbi:MAG TPA: putative metallopeptidase [Candidatus Dormibacteraeota bacterium]|jgi:hypothetical protein|nr:putative metallopeptidase [Candidatus Dormibacteraeota bacterium]
MAKGRKAKKPKVPVKVEWERLLLVEKTIHELVGLVHKHLERAKIVAVGKPRGTKKMCCGGIAKLTTPSKALRALVKDDIGDVHYIAVIGLDRWEKLEAEARKRVLDHLLCHAGGRDDDRDVWFLVDHDVEEFTAVIKRHGLDDSPGLRAFVSQAKQLKLELK